MTMHTQPKLDTLIHLDSNNKTVKKQRKDAMDCVFVRKL